MPLSLSFSLSLSLQVTAEDGKKDDDEISTGKSCSFAMLGPSFMLKVICTVSVHKLDLPEVKY